MHTELLNMAYRQNLRPASLNIASNAIRAFLRAMLRTTAIADTAPKLVIATPPGHQREIGALIIALTALESGWKPIYLGPNLPANDITAAVQHHHAGAVALRCVSDSTLNNIEDQLAEMQRGVPAHVKIVVCSRDRLNPISNKKLNVIIVPGLVNFRQSLESLTT